MLKQRTITAFILAPFGIALFLFLPTMALARLIGVTVLSRCGNGRACRDSLASAARGARRAVAARMVWLWLLRAARRSG